MEWDCIEPGAIQEWELDACADGETPLHVAEHLERCPACRARVAERMAFEHRLRRILHRHNCPSPDMLRDYHWGFLPADEHQRIASHLDICPHCAAELADLAEFVPAERSEPSGTLLDRAHQAAAQVRLVVAQILSPAPSPIPALRGDTRGNTRDLLLFDAEDVAVSVNLELEETGAHTLLGQVLSSEPVARADSYARLTAQEEGVEPVQTPLDANGGFTFPDLRPGIYQLVVCLPDRRIVVPALMLEAEP